MPAEEIKSTTESISEGRNRLKAKTALSIATIGWLLIGFSLNTILFNSFPLKLATPEWQLNFIAALLSSSPSLLIGATLIPLALILNQTERILQNWNRTIGRTASWFAILLILIAPLQFFIGSRALKNQSETTSEAISKLKTIVKVIGGLNSEDELRAYVASLPDAPRLPDKFDAAFPVIKQRAIENIEAQINTANENSKLQTSQGTQIFLKEAIRNSAQAVLLAAAFSALANLNSKTKNPLTRFFAIFLKGTPKTSKTE